MLFWRIDRIRSSQNFISFRKILFGFALCAISCSAGSKKYSVFHDCEEIIVKGSIYEINNYHDLGGGTVVFPEGTTLLISGGMLDNGTIIGCNTKVIVKSNSSVFGLKLKIGGSWNVSKVYDKWFEFDQSDRFVSNQIINNILSLSNDKTPCHIFFNENRTYYFSLQTNEKASVGNTLGSHMENGVRKFHYNEIFSEKYSYLRIFTIPSKTHLTINSRFQMLPTNQGLYYVFWEYGKEDITIDGKGMISGDVQSHFYTDPFFEKTSFYGEWGYLLKFIKCQNLKIKDVTLADSFGDLLSIDCSLNSNEKGHRFSENISINNVKFLRARRNGISITAKDVVIENCHFEDCGVDKIKGTAPRAAVDFENSYVLKYPETGNENVKMKNCIFTNNKYDVSATNVNVPRYGKVAVTISDCVFSAPIRLNPTNHWIRFEKCVIPSFSNWIDKISESTPIRHVEFVKCKINSMPVIMKKNDWQNKFENCVINNVE